jgi:hypothetical protein
LMRLASAVVVPDSGLAARSGEVTCPSRGPIGTGVVKVIRFDSPLSPWRDERLPQVSHQSLTDRCRVC